MIGLFRYIKESIFDDEEDQLEKVGASVMVDQIKRPDSAFNKEWVSYDTNLAKHNQHKIDKITWENGKLLIPTNNFERMDVHDAHSLSYYVEGTKELVCSFFKDKSRCELTPDTLCQTVTCASFFKQITNKVKDINIVIDPDTVRKSLCTVNVFSRVNFQGFMRPILENVNIDFVGDFGHSDLRKPISFGEMPTFKNVKSNADVITVYDCMAFDADDLDKIIPIFEWPHKATIRDFNKHEDVEITIKGLKKAKAIANNPKRYHPITPIFKVKNNAKLSDIIDTSGFKELKQFTYKDNNIALIISKSPIKSMLHCEPEPLKTETHQMTKDGFYVYLDCER